MRFFHYLLLIILCFFFFHDTATTDIYTLPLHDALPICPEVPPPVPGGTTADTPARSSGTSRDRKSTRLNSSHVAISYAVFCLKKKKKCDKLTNSSTQSIDQNYSSSS